MNRQNSIELPPAGEELAYFKQQFGSASLSGRELQNLVVQHQATLNFSAEAKWLLDQHLVAGQPLKELAIESGKSTGELLQLRDHILHAVACEYYDFLRMIIEDDPSDLEQDDYPQ